MIARRVAAVCATAGLLAVPTSLRAMDPPVRTVPSALGPTEPVSSELGYEGAPVAAIDATERTWVAYNNSPGHVSALAEVRLRFQDAGKTWSLPTIVAAGDGTYGVGTGGMAAETAAQGGRLWLATIRFRPTSTSTATDFSTSVRYRDPASGTWSTPAGLPAISATQTIGTGLHVRPDGTVMASAYGVPTGGTQYVARLYVRDAGTGAWSARSTVSLANRGVSEPTLVSLADDRLMMLFRSDGSPPYYSYIYSTISSDDGLTWSTPVRIVIHGSGLPSGMLLPSGEVVVCYRGFSEPANPPGAFPPRLTMLLADGTPTGDQVDVLGTQQRYLYGQIVRGPPGNPDRWIYSLEAPDGQSGGGAVVYSVPLRWAVRS